VSAPATSAIAERADRCAQCGIQGGRRRRGELEPHARLHPYQLLEHHVDPRTAQRTTSCRSALLCRACWLTWRRGHGMQLTRRERRSLGHMLYRRAHVSAV
jgi:hypothetical protein